MRRKSALADPRRGLWCTFGRIHQTLKMTPAMKAGIAAKPWTVEEILALTDSN